MEPKGTFGKRLARIMRDRGLSQGRLAKMSGLAQQHISSLVLGKTEPMYTTLLRLHDGIGCSWEELMEGEE